MQHCGGRPCQQREVGKAPGYTRTGLRAEPNSKSPTQRGEKEGGGRRGTNVGGRGGEGGKNKSTQEPGKEYSTATHGNVFNDT
eukprot:4336585-Pyramimonas_sp.AAC.1